MKTFGSILLLLSILISVSLCAQEDSNPKGTIWVKTKPSQAEIYIDGKLMGKSPRINTGISVGEHLVELRLDGFDPISKNVTVSALKTTDLVVDMSGEIMDSSEEPEVKMIYHAWSAGLNLGAYWGNKYHANFYNGAETNLNNISRVIFDQNYAKPEIVAAIGHNYEDNLGYYGDFASGGGYESGVEIPFELQYKVATTVGIYGSYNLNRTSRVFVQFNYVRLKTSAAFNIHWYTPGYESFDDFTQCALMGEEERYMIDLGFSKEWFFDENEEMSFFVEFGVHLTNTLVRQNSIEIPVTNSDQPLVYSIMNTGNQYYDPYGSLNTQYFDVTEGGIGFGGMVGTGVRLYFTPFLSIEPSFNLFYTSINLIGGTDVLNDNYNREIDSYSDPVINCQAFVRLIYINPWLTSKNI